MKSVADWCVSPEFLSDNMMGPNSMAIVQELLQGQKLTPGMRVLDLGCGRGLTSVYLAKTYGVQVFAADLWILAAENYQRFRSLGLENQIIPIHADAGALPFAQDYFDAIVSVDSYHYFGNNDTFAKEFLLPLLKKDGLAALAFPGMKFEVLGNVPAEMAPFWEEEALQMWHSMDWWRPKLEPSLSGFRIWEMNCFRQAWADWLATENHYAVEDRAMMQADNGRYMNLVAITGRKK